MSHLQRPKLFDITLPLSPDTLCYPGEHPPILSRQTDLKCGDDLTASRLAIGCHVGTHIDAPAHFLETGMTLDELPLETFFGPAEVVDCRNISIITEPFLRSRKIPKASHLLLQTDNSSLLHQSEFSDDYTVLTLEGAHYLTTFSPLSLGFDYYSLDPVGSERGYPVHTTLAREGISVFVCLDLWNISSGEYLFAGFPLRLQGAEGSPVRAVLMRQ